MNKKSFKPGAMLNPLPVIMASVGEKDGESNIITIAWTGIVNSNPPMTYISVKPQRYSHDLIEKTGEFVINLVGRDLAEAADYCGVKSGRDVDKWKEMSLTKEECQYVSCPQIKESPLSLECKVKEILRLPSHDMFLAEIVNVNVQNEIVNDKGRICLDSAELICYNHGEYYNIAEHAFGRFGYSVMKQKTRNRIEKEKKRNQRNRHRLRKKIKAENYKK